MFIPENTIAIIISQTNWEDDTDGYFYSVNFIIANGSQTKQQFATKQDVKNLENQIFNTKMPYYFV